MGESEQVALGKDAAPRFHREKADVAPLGKGLDGTDKIGGGFANSVDSSNQLREGADHDAPGPELPKSVPKRVLLHQRSDL
jgi:hypothetical protein